MKTKLKLFTFISIISLIILAIPQSSHAALQSNGGTVATKNIDQWMLQIRQMETLGGGLGLNDTINTTNLTSTATEKNNIDVHMEKNTEYGALVILSASSYGNPNKIESGETTTGNSTGVVMNINKEWVSAGAGITDSTIWRNATSRYKNMYTTSGYGGYVAKRGDAILNWHGSTYSRWILTQYTSGLLRSYSGSIFSYDGESNGSSIYSYESCYYSTHPSRAVMVIGDNF